MRDGTAPAACNGPRTEWAPHNRTNIFCMLAACSNFMERRHAIALKLGKAGLQVGLQTRTTTSAGHPRTIGYASPLLTTLGAKVVQATVRRRTRKAAHNSDSGKGARI